LNSSKQKFQTIDEYIKTFPKDIQKILESVRQTIKSVAPEAEEAISYQIPTFKLNGNLVHFAAYKNHIGFYPGSEAINVFKKEIASYKSSKGAIQFPIDKPMPLSLIKRIVMHRVKEFSVSKKKKNKSKK
jgi:uncharacterized protein YdhG (YjbR/CyaY superfamily)